MCGGILASVRILMCTVPYTQCGKNVRRWCVRDDGERSDQLQVPGIVPRPGEAGAKFEKREVELSYENRKLDREDGYRQIIKPIRLVSNSNRNLPSVKKVNNLSDFIPTVSLIETQKLQDQDLEADAWSDIG